MIMSFYLIGFAVSLFTAYKIGKTTAKGEIKSLQNEIIWLNGDVKAKNDYIKELQEIINSIDNIKYDSIDSLQNLQF